MIRILARIDLHIRRRWWRNYTDNPTWSFSRAIMAAEALADNQWSFDYASVLYAGQKGGNAWEPPGPHSWTNPHAPLGEGGRKGKGRKGKGKGKGEGKGAKGAGKGSLKISAFTHNGQRVKCAKSKNGQWFCSFFNVQNNCRNNTGACSNGMHRCNFMVSPTRVCNGAHSAKDHTGT